MAGALYNDVELYEGAIVNEFVVVKGGYVYKGAKPVHWCPHA